VGREERLPDQGPSSKQQAASRKQQATSNKQQASSFKSFLNINPIN
jgi:hypothetical protein